MWGQGKKSYLTETDGCRETLKQPPREESKVRGKGPPSSSSQGFHSCAGRIIRCSSKAQISCSWICSRGPQICACSPGWHSRASFLQLGSRGLKGTECVPASISDCTVVGYREQRNKNLKVWVAKCMMWNISLYYTCAMILLVKLFLIHSRKWLTYGCRLEMIKYLEVRNFKDSDNILFLNLGIENIGAYFITLLTYTYMLLYFTNF